MLRRERAMRRFCQEACKTWPQFLEACGFCLLEASGAVWYGNTRPVADVRLNLREHAVASCQDIQTDA